jgi:putative ABC transport system ATP-binding protein
MIELESIKKYYKLNGKDVLILKGINLYIAQGEFVSIMGPSGSGKSTLSAILGCLSTPSHGKYSLNGQDVTSLDANALARLRNQSIGFIFQDFNLLSGLSAVENVELPLVYGGMTSKARRERAMECLTAVGLENKAFNRPFQLSGGQKQRVAIARALVNHPKFLFADEPTGALDKKTGQEILGIMQKLNMMGHTVIQVTHSPSDALYSKRILHLVDGNIVREESVEKPMIGVGINDNASAHEEVVAKMWRVAQFAPVVGDRDVRAIQTLIQDSKSRDSLIAASRAIVRWDGADVAASVETLFSSSDWVVRTEIVKNLNLRPQEESIPYYVRALSDENPWVRHVAITALKDIDQEYIPKELQEKVVSCRFDRDERVRATAVFIIGKWSIENKDFIMNDVLTDPDNRVRANAVECIQSLSSQDKFLDRLIDMARNDRNNRVRANAALIVGRFNAEVASEVAEDMLRAQDVLMRSSGAWLMGMLRSKRFNHSLLNQLKVEKEEVVLNQLVRSLAKISRDQFSLNEQVASALSRSQEGA